ncbi:hypothetical protein KY346_04920 [Candidatus Woesearchaeota archaeon]|nr:hypothetical protein [Candidatus Woesearchaeota archaeon]
MDNLDQRLEKASDCHIHTPIGSDGSTSLKDMKPEIAKLDFAAALDHNNIIWHEWHPFIQELNKTRTDNNTTYTLPGAEVSLAQGKTIHIAIYFTKRESTEEMLSRMARVQNGLLTEINDRIITKFDESLDKAIKHFSKNEYIRQNPDKYLISRHMVLAARRPNYILGAYGRKGFYYTDISRTMNALNKRMLEDKVIESPEQGYGTPLTIEGYFQKKTANAPETQGMLLADYKRMTCMQALPFLSDVADIIAVAHEDSKEFVEWFAKCKWINAIGFNNKKLAEQYGLMILEGSDYHGGEFRKERIGYDTEGNRLKSCVKTLKEKGFHLFS